MDVGHVMLHYVEMGLARRNIIMEGIRTIKLYI
jgi:hypothetical protein